MKTLEQYAMLCAKEKEIKAQKDLLSVELLTYMQEHEIGAVKTDYGTLSKAQKFVYTYSDEYTTKEKEIKQSLKEMKEKEEAKLEPEIKEYITFRLKKI